MRINREQVQRTIVVGTAGICLGGGAVELYDIAMPDKHVTRPDRCVEAKVSTREGVATPQQLGNALMAAADVRGDTIEWGAQIAAYPGHIQNGDTYSAVIGANGDAVIFDKPCPKPAPAE